MTEWGDGPFDHVDLVTGVHVALEPKDNVIPRLDVIPRWGESCRMMHEYDAGDGSGLHDGEYLGDVIGHRHDAIP
jgi:hypothetical protein